MRRLHQMPFGTEVDAGGVTFRLWRPSVRDAEVVLEGQAPVLMDAAADGWAERRIQGAGPGTRYRFRVGGDLLVPDPGSRFQPDGPLGASVVVDPLAYEWSDLDWRGRPWEEAVIWEAHVGAATPQGDYRSLEAKLPHLAESGVTAIELMPISDWAGARNWGYDGVLPFAPAHPYGAPEDLKHLIDSAHGLDLMIFLDVVYNHFGPCGNFLPSYAASFFNEGRETPWGAAINLDGPGGRAVRDYFIHNALYWLEEYRFDGLRLDAVHALIDEGRPAFLEELAENVRARNPDRAIHLILENERNEARRLIRRNGKPVYYSAQWNDDWHHCWHRLLTGETEGYYEDFDAPAERLARAFGEGFAYQGDASRRQNGRPRGESSRHLPPTAFVNFLQNHDQIGNRALGERLVDLASPERLKIAQISLLLAPSIPMLFMGEEWGATAPFLYFVDFSHDPVLSRAVRDGRRSEFAHFAAFSNPERIPDPTQEETFLRSKIDWSQAEREPYRSEQERVRTLLALRATHVVPLLKSGFRSASHDFSPNRLLESRWAFEAGDLRLCVNFGESFAPLALDAAETVLWPFETSSGRRLGPWEAVVTVRDAHV